MAGDLGVGMPRGSGQATAAGPVTFALHTLGWRAFQDLGAIVLRDVMGQSFQAFADSNDAGRDGAFYGRWRPSHSGGSYAGMLPRGPFVLQCKHTSKADATLTPSMVLDELGKVPRLVSRGLCNSYILLTNARITGSSEARIRESLQAAGVEHPLVLGGGWVCQTIASRQSLRMYVPRVYGLGDLSQIFDGRSYDQAETLLRYLKPELSTFVPTDAYRRAATGLQRHGFILLLGEPGAGKSVIASTLAMCALDGWGCSVIRAHSAEELLAHWNVHEPSQFFWIDDAFGAVRHDWTLTQGWSMRMASVMTAVKNGAKVVMTSRDYIYRDARRALKEYAYPLLQESQVVVDVAELDRHEREQILYNHVRLGDQPASFRRALMPHLDAAADAQPFRPEAARRLGQTAFTHGLALSRPAIVDFLEKPKPYLAEVFGQLDSDQQAALTLVYVASRLAPTFGSDPRQVLLLERLGSSASGTAAALEALTGTFLRYGSEPGLGDGPGWSFHHPTLRESFAAFVASRPHLLDVFIAGLTDTALLTQIDCGAAPVTGTLVSIPPQLYPSVARRLAAMDSSSLADWSRHWAWHQFFVQRCSDAFLREYLEHDAGFVTRLLQFGSYLGVVPEPRVLCRLHQAGLLRDDDRRAAIATASDLAVETPDADWLDAPEWRVLASETERDVILARVRTELVPRLSEEIGNWVGNYRRDEDPDAYYQPLEETLLRYASALSTDPAASSDIEAAVGELRSLRANADDDYEPPAAFRWAPPRAPDTIRRDRSVFDDIDA
jgi:hypothetical protein